MQAVLLASSAIVGTAWSGLARAQDATWVGGTPGGLAGSDYKNAVNWENQIGPPAGTAFFGATSTFFNSVVIDVSTTVGGWTFKSGEPTPGYTFDVGSSLEFTGAGIVVNGGSAAMINNNVLKFHNSSTAGSAAITNAFNGNTQFLGASTAGSAAITNEGFLDFFDNSKAGNASISNGNRGFLDFNNTSTAGSATITNSGILEFNDSSTASSAAITNAYILNFSNSSSAGDATIVNNNRILFLNTSTAGNAAITNGASGTTDFGRSTGPLGDHKLSAGSINGDGTFFLGGNELTVGSNNLSTTVTGVIADGGSGGDTGGSLVKTGTGTLTLSGANAYTGGTTVDAGTLRAGAAGAFVGNSAYAVNGGTLDLNGFNLTMSSLSGTGGTVALGSVALALNQMTDTSYAGTLTGTGSLTKAGTGTLTLSGASTYTGATTINSGTLSVSGSIASSSITNNSGLTFFDSSTAGRASITNNGTLKFFNTGAAGSASITSTGSMDFFNSSTAGNATITNNGGGRSSIVDNASGGTARFILNDSGLLDISGLTTGSTTAGSIEGAGSVLLGSKNLTVGGNNLSTTFSGVIQDDRLLGGTGGSLTKAGAGTLTLSGVNTYTGATTIDSGTLAVNGSIASSSALTVNAGGTLGGNGTVGNTTINTGGSLAPGNSIGLLTVQGSLTFMAAASYMVEVSPSNADRTNVTGIATLGGATVNASFAPGTFVAKQYTILNAAGGVSGGFNGPVNTNLPANFKSSLSYDANNAYLNLSLFSVPSGLNSNQQNVANELSNFFDTTGGIPLVFAALSRSALSQAAGETATGSQQTTFDAMTQFMGVMTDPFTAGRGAPESAAVGYADQTLAYAAKRSPSDALAAIYRKAPPMAPAFQERWNVWAAAFGGSRNTDGNTVVGSNDTRSSIGGVAVGADYWFAPNTLSGFSLAGGGTNFSVANGGSGRSDLFQAGAFVRHTVGSAYITAAAAYGWQDITTDRVVGGDRLRTQFNANSYSGRIEGGNRYLTPWLGGVGLTPYAAARITALDLPSYAETAGGANTFALAYAGKTVTSTRSELGFRTDKSFAVTDAILTLRGRVAWAHDFNSDRSASATFQMLPGASFVVNGAAQARDAALTTAAAEMKWTNGWAVASTFEGEFSDVTRSYAGKGVVRYAW
jgi:autotransporter-associated beta strand protein